MLKNKLNTKLDLKIKHVKPKNNFLVPIILTTIPIGGIGVDICAASLPTIGSSLHISEMLVNNIINSYLLGSALGAFILGTLSDYFGRRNILLMSFLIFVIVSLVISTSHNIYLIILLRGIQGFCATGSAFVCRAIIPDIYKGDKLKKISILTSMIWALGPIIAPVIGGYINYYLGWHAIFYALFFYGIIILSMIMFFLNETNSQLTNFDFKTSLIAVKNIVINTKFMTSVLCLSVSYSYILIYFVLGSFILQNTLNLSSVEFGYSGLFIGVAFFLGSTANRIFLIKYHHDIVTGMCLFLVLSLTILLLAFMLILPDSFFLFYLPIWFISVLAGIINSNSTVNCLKLIPYATGTAMSVMGALLLTLSSFCMFIINYIGDATVALFVFTYLFLSILSLFFYVKVYFNIKSIFATREKLKNV